MSELWVLHIVTGCNRTLEAIQPCRQRLGMDASIGEAPLRAEPEEVDCGRTGLDGGRWAV
ncbi:MAG: hypothetical protein M9963_03490 [Kiritimatiellae bacterium]|nr:hypothetical protein [Kiritimatiellia bacterium]